MGVSSVCSAFLLPDAFPVSGCIINGLLAVGVKGCSQDACFSTGAVELQYKMFGFCSNIHKST